MENKTLKLAMINYQGIETEYEFKLKKYGSAFNFYKRMIAIKNICKSEFEADLKSAVEFLPHVVGKEAFAVPGLADNVKFEEQLEEFFINDPFALQQLMSEVSFFLYPAMSRRFSEIMKQQK